MFLQDDKDLSRICRPAQLGDIPPSLVLVCSVEGDERLELIQTEDQFRLKVLEPGRKAWFVGSRADTEKLFK